MNVFDLFAKVELDTTAFVQGMATITKVGGVALAAASAALVKFGYDSVKVGAEFDKSMSQVAATLGYTVEELSDETSKASREVNKLRDFAMEMGSTTVFSARQASEALNYMALAGYNADQSMQMLPAVLDLAAAGSIDLARASDMVTDAQTALGLSMDETTTMVDQMARTASRSNTSVEQLGDAILTVGGTAKYMAGGTEQINTVLGVLADNGIKGSEAGTHLRNMLLKLSSPTEEAAALLDSLGVSAFDADGKMRDFSELFPELNRAMADMTDEEKLQAFSTLFNARDIAAANALLGTSVERWEDLSTEIENSAGAASEMAKVQLDNLAGDITLFKSALEGAQIVVSDQLTPTLREFVQLGTEGISEITDKLKEGDLAGAAEQLGNVVSEGVTIIVGKLPELVEAGGQLLTGLVQGFTENADVIADGVANTVVAIVEFFSENIGTIIEGVMTLAGEVAGALISHLPEIMVGIGEGIINGIAGLGEGITNAFNGIMSGVDELFDVTGIATSFIEEADRIVSEADKIESSWEKVKDARDKLVGDANAEHQYYSDLVNELKGITDQNGKVKQGYEERAKFIIDELSEATDLELEMKDNIIQGYDELIGKVEESIEKQRAEAILAAEKDAYVEAVNSKREASKKLAEINIQLADSEGAIQDKMTEVSGYMHRDTLLRAGYSQEETDSLMRDWAMQQLGMDDLAREHDELTAVLNENNQDIMQYEKDHAAFAKENYDEIGQTLTTYSETNGRVTQETIDELEKQKEAYRIEMESMKGIVDDSGIADAHYEQAKKAYDEVSKELEKTKAKYESETKQMTNTINAELATAGTRFTSTLGGSIRSGEGNVRSATAAVRQGAVNEADAATGMLHNSGVNAAIGFGNGIESQLGYVAAKAEAMAERAYRASMRKLDERSPSRVFMKIGAYTGEGFVLGIDSTLDAVREAGETMSDEFINSVDTDTGSLFDVDLSRDKLTTQRSSESINMDITSRLDALQNGLYNIIVDAISDGVDIKWNERELARMVKTYA